MGRKDVYLERQLRERQEVIYTKQAYLRHVLSKQAFDETFTLKPCRIGTEVYCNGHFITHFIVSDHYINKRIANALINLVGALKSVDIEAALLRVQEKNARRVEDVDF